MAAETGSWKTLAYGAPVLSKLLSLRKDNPNLKGIQFHIFNLCVSSTCFDAKHSFERADCPKTPTIGRQHWFESSGSAKRQKGIKF